MGDEQLAVAIPLALAGFYVAVLLITMGFLIFAHRLESDVLTEALENRLESEVLTVTLENRLEGLVLTETLTARPLVELGGMGSPKLSTVRFSLVGERFMMTARPLVEPGGMGSPNRPTVMASLMSVATLRRYMRRAV